MSTPAAHPHRWQIFEVVLGVPLLLALILQWAVPLAFPPGLLAPLRILVGAALLLAGGAIVLRARGDLARQGQPTDPGLPTTVLVTTGVYAYSRNPLYLGGVALFAGLALVLNLPWALILLVPALVACHYVLIVPEERYLTAVFGQEYLRYAGTVRRWAGRR